MKRIHVMRACYIKQLDEDNVLESLRSIAARIDYLESQTENMRSVVDSLINTLQGRSGYEDIVQHLRNLLVIIPCRDADTAAHVSNVEQFVRGKIDNSTLQNRRPKTKALRNKN